MKIRISLMLVAVAAISFAFGWGTAGNSAGLSEKTIFNLSIAMHGEAFAYAKYLLYAHHARQGGEKELADLFEETAKVEHFQHFAEEAQLAGLVGRDADNLKEAIKGESEEIETMYLEFAQEATASGDKAAAERFEEIRHDEMGHRDAFQAAMKTWESKTAGSQ
jgi:rubrerythrin